MRRVVIPVMMWYVIYVCLWVQVQWRAAHTVPGLLLLVALVVAITVVRR